MVSVVLQVLYGPQMPRRPATDQKMEGHDKTHCSNRKALPKRRVDLSRKAEAGTIALGV